MKGILPKLDYRKKHYHIKPVNPGEIRGIIIFVLLKFFYLIFVNNCVITVENML